MDTDTEAIEHAPRCVECPRCGAYVATSDDLCWRCGQYLPPGFYAYQI